MSYGRTAAQDIALEGRRLLNRHYYGDGRWGWADRTAQRSQEFGRWTVTKTRPKRLTWAKPSGPLARKVHAVRYVLRAERDTGEVGWLAVWLCGQHAQSEPKPQSHPPVVCSACLARLIGQTEAPLPAELLRP